MVFNYGQKCAEQIQSQAEKCLGESTKFDQILKKRSPARCLHVSGTALVVLVLGLLLVTLCRHYLKDLLQWLQNLDEWQGLLLFLAMFTIVSFPMTWGYIVLNVAAGYLYGFSLGLVVVCSCVTFGFSTAFLVCRRFLRDFVRSKLESDSLKAIMLVVEGKRGFKVIALTRLTPVPFGLQNGLFAVTNVSTPKYIISSTLGLLPTQILNTYMGSTFRSLEDVMEEKSGGYIILFVQFLISAVLMTYVIRRARKELNRTCDEVDHEVQANGIVVTAQPEALLLSLKKHSASYDVESQRLDSNTGRKVNFNSKGHKRSQSASAILVEISDETKGSVTP